MLSNHIKNLELDTIVINGANGMDPFSKKKKTKAEHYGMKMTFRTLVYTVMIAILKVFFFY